MIFASATPTIIYTIMAFQLLCFIHCWTSKKITIGKKLILSLFIGLLSIIGVVIYIAVYSFFFKKKSGEQLNENNDLFYPRQKALESEFGKFDNVLQSGIPFILGYEAGGQPNVYFFDNHLDGTVAITADLIGQEQKPSDAGNYELMIATKEKNDLLIDILKNLSFYTMDESVNSGDTMDLPLNQQADTNICAVVFDCYKKFKVNELDCGAMVMIGITQEELEYRNQHGGKDLIEKLKQSNVYPYFDLERKSVV